MVEALLNLPFDIVASCAFAFTLISSTSLMPPPEETKFILRNKELQQTLTAEYGGCYSLRILKRSAVDTSSLKLT